ncbi:pelargonidin 3-O-(6-caffeoylglucoside) 5-O-(6-O-malonylglucoside) 4'''-malonyltransferase-like [Salvia miltiorrhiza]|uniref:pelargonidin 3-O-(6-caffeoylglucoside) 5-O-(6-O-malonylglucoside) 4'''-malonyltransferase-like n=1 Tax=Salvia miltiorrhiza TaxID=226208 RepID=UPI0025AC588C|nr:pelargonidin 3-O-(6-caffeoylglucoside) 5-O-(6-O-malonylglucoside) 4'''-malonyltransferase-like [Salvia miltiorrhiza]
MNKISSKLVKPHTPTPQNLKNYKLSFIDELVRPINNAVVLFYESIAEDAGSHILEASLARILVEFYPLAGRFMKKDSWIDCSDEGAELVEAEALDVELMDLGPEMEIHELRDLLPDQHFRRDEAPENPLLSIQITRFSCGGAAIAISVSHKVLDGSSLWTFVVAWSDAANPYHDKKVNPTFHLSSLLPSVSKQAPDFGEQRVGADHNVALKRVLFNKETLRSLKLRIRHTDGKALSGVRVVCAVIAKALIRVDGAIHGRSRRSVILQAVDMRERSIPPQSRHACGNFAVPAMTRCIQAGADVGVDQLVLLMGESVRNAITRHAEILSPDVDGRHIYTDTMERLIQHVSQPETNIINFTDCSGFQFHDCDFGWGTPLWTRIHINGPSGNNFVLLMSDKEGHGIEAWIHLSQHEMLYFDENYLFLKEYQPKL